jgi:tripartite-type tricarboxylate transporter receptor subunit TctC
MWSFSGKRLALAGAVLLTFAGLASAAEYPERPIHWIVPYPPGGSTDILARIVAQKMQEDWRVPVVVEDKGGASGIVGVFAAASSAPDGYTLLMTATGPEAINPSLFRNLPYDPVKSFDSITLIAKLPMLLLANPSVPAKNVKGLIAWLKAQHEKAMFASIGIGTPSHLAMEMFSDMAGLQKMTHVPYKGSGPADVALIGGHEAPIMFDSVLSSLQFVKSGRLKVIAVSTANRLPALPDVPTVSESGLSGFDAYTWTAAVAPAGMPKDRLDKISKELEHILNLPDVREKFALQGAIPGATTPKEFSDFVQIEIQKWHKVIQSANVHVE